MALLNKEKAADWLGVTVTTLDNWRWKGIGPAFVKLPKQIVYSEAALEAYAAANTHQPSVQAFMEDRRVAI